MAQALCVFHAQQALFPLLGAVFSPTACAHLCTFAARWMAHVLRVLQIRRWQHSTSPMNFCVRGKMWLDGQACGV